MNLINSLRHSSAGGQNLIESSVYKQLAVTGSLLVEYSSRNERTWLYGENDDWS